MPYDAPWVARISEEEKRELQQLARKAETSLSDAMRRGARAYLRRRIREQERKQAA